MGLYLNTCNNGFLKSDYISTDGRNETIGEYSSISNTEWQSKIDTLSSRAMFRGSDRGRMTSKVAMPLINCLLAKIVSGPTAMKNNVRLCVYLYKEEQILNHHSQINL